MKQKVLLTVGASVVASSPAIAENFNLPVPPQSLPQEEVVTEVPNLQQMALLLTPEQQAAIYKMTGIASDRIFFDIGELEDLTSVTLN